MPCLGCQRRREVLKAAAQRVGRQLRERRQQALRERRAAQDALRAKRRVRP
jgi:hypothetical protein